MRKQNETPIKQLQLFFIDKFHFCSKNKSTFLHTFIYRKIIWMFLPVFLHVNTDHDYIYWRMTGLKIIIIFNMHIAFWWPFRNKRYFNISPSVNHKSNFNNKYLIIFLHLTVIPTSFHLKEKERRFFVLHTWMIANKKNFCSVWMRKSSYDDKLEHDLSQNFD